MADQQRHQRDRARAAGCQDRVVAKLDVLGKRVQHHGPSGAERFLRGPDERQGTTGRGSHQADLGDLGHPLSGYPVADDQCRRGERRGFSQRHLEDGLERPLSGERGERATVGEVALLSDRQLGGALRERLVADFERVVDGLEGLGPDANLFLQLYAGRTQRRHHAVEGGRKLAQLVPRSHVHVR